ncbi:MAG: accessory Sec system translocase SecA2 [Bryobacteraceae bacterium]
MPKKSARPFWRNLFRGPAAAESLVPLIHERRAALGEIGQSSWQSPAWRTMDLASVFAVCVAAAERVLGLKMFDVQLGGALALTSGKIAEMQTGEGKTLAAVPAVAWYARQGAGVHVMTVNDYLARRDAQWMGGIYEFLGLSVGYVQQGMTMDERRRAYACDITYATANEIGFDLLRDGLALNPREQVHRPFAAAVIDEADSILIDEARIPLVIAGGEAGQDVLANQVDAVTRFFRRGRHFTLDEYSRNVALTDTGIRAAETSFGCGNLFDEENLALLTAVQDSLHAHALLRRNVDYLVKDGAIESVDEFKGRIAENRRWPAGLHTAIEAKEGLALKTQGRILGSITLQNLISLYPQICGMTGTAATQADEFQLVYGLEVEVIPTNRPMIRVDHPDVLFARRSAKEQAVIGEIRKIHSAGRPVLVGTRSVEESERLSARLIGIPHQVLNARHEEEEAGMVARAGQLGAVTISTNMAGRGTDIQLGPGVAEIGGLHVIGTNRHESRRIDNQLRGRAGRQGDPGSSQFFVSLEDDLLMKYGGPERNEAKGVYRDIESIQRVAEGQNLEIRRFLHKYESVIEGQRQKIQQRRQAILTGETPVDSDLERQVSLRTIDDQWADYLATITDLREGVQWLSWGGRDPLHEYLTSVHAIFTRLEEELDAEIATRLEAAQMSGVDPSQRGATWTYLTTDQPFGTATERIMRGLVRKLGHRAR